MGKKNGYHCGCGRGTLAARIAQAKRRELGGAGCDDLRCALKHSRDASAERPGPPGIVAPRMHRTRPARDQGVSRGR